MSFLLLILYRDRPTDPPSLPYNYFTNFLPDGVCLLTTEGAGVVVVGLWMSPLEELGEGPDILSTIIGVKYVLF